MKQMSAHYLKELDFPALRNCKSWARSCTQSAKPTWGA